MTAPFVPVPEVTVGGVVLAQSPGALQVLVDTADVDWGTDDPLAQPDPQTGSLRLLDLSLTWAARADLMGSPVTFRWVPDAGLVALGFVPTIYFRGRVTGLKIHEPEEFTDATGYPFLASQVDLTLTSVELDLANRFVTDGSAWPAETIGARAARISALAGLPVHVRSFWTTAEAVAVPAADLARTSARDLLLQLYNSCGGDRMIYAPDSHSYQHLGRRQHAARTLMAFTRATNPANPRTGQGVYLVPVIARTATAVPAAGEPLLYAHMNGLWLTSDDWVSKSAGQRITRSQVTWFDLNAADRQMTAVRVDPAANEGLIGQRSVTLDSLHNNGVMAGVNADDLLSMATQEGAEWRPPRVTWDLRDSGGFDYSPQVHVALRGHATGYPITVSRTWWAHLGIRPLFSAIGGRITYADGRWVLELQLASWVPSGGNGARVKQHLVTWEELDADPANPIVWTDGPAPYGLHDSVTFEDLGYVGTGFGANGFVGPDTGWDEYQ